MNTIAPHLVRRIISEPDGLIEFCRFLAITVDAFLKLSLRYTLPPLLADGESKALVAIAQAVFNDTRLSVLVFEQPARILSHVLMLQGIGQTTKTLKLISDTMKAELPDPQTFNLWTLIAGCMVNIIAELVTALGDEDPNTVEAVCGWYIRLSVHCLSKSSDRQSWVFRSSPPPWTTRTRCRMARGPTPLS